MPTSPETIPIPASLTTSDRRFGRFLIGFITAGFFALLLLGLAGGWALLQTQRQGAMVVHTMQVELELQRFKAATERIAAARRGHMLTGDERFVDLFEAAVTESDLLLDEVDRLTQDNPAQQQRLQALRERDAAYIEVARTSIETLRNDPASDGTALFLSDSGAETIGAIRQMARAMISAEQTLLEERSDEQASQQLAAYLILAIAGVLFIVVAAGVFWATRRMLGELRRSHKTLRGLNEVLEGAVQIRTADLQRANDEIQRFAYIVSHDLRSPLVNVMGFTSELEAAIAPLTTMMDRAEATAPEIVTEDARLAVREDLPESIGFIRTSTEKMDRLINAILRLSREGRRVIMPETLDMDALVEGITDSLAHRLDEIGAEIRLETPLPEIVSDRVAVEQILSNLIENAVKYLKPGRPGRIVVRGKRLGERVVFEIEDNGRGIDPKDHQRVFDLFRRSGHQDQPGEGIGLAHVRAMAYRLGGVITLDSELDEGATFRLSIPARYEAPKEA